MGQQVMSRYATILNEEALMEYNLCLHSERYHLSDFEVLVISYSRANATNAF